MKQHYLKKPTLIFGKQINQTHKGPKVNNSKWKSKLVEAIEVLEAGIEMAKDITSEVCSSDPKTNFALSFLVQKFKEKFEEIKPEASIRHPSLPWQEADFLLRGTEVHSFERLGDEPLLFVRYDFPKHLKFLTEIFVLETPHFQSKGWGIRLSTEDAYSVLSYLQEKYSYEIGSIGYDEDSEMVLRFIKEKPHSINDDSDLCLWSTQAFGDSNISQSAIRCFKLAIEDTKLNAQNLNPERFLQYYESSGTDFIYSNYKTEDLLLLPEPELIKAFKLRELAVNSLADIDEMIWGRQRVASSQSKGSLSHLM